MASKWATCGAALLLGLAVASDARAGDKFTVYLEDAASISTKGLTGGNALTTVDLDEDESADATEYIWYRGGGWGGGRGWGWGGRGWGWGGRGWGWGRGWGYAGWGWGRGWGWGWGRGWGWGGWAWGWPYYYAPSYYYYNPCPTPYYYYYSYAPMTVDVATAPPTAVASAQIRSNSAGYFYNGGPSNPVPYPQGGPDFGPAPRQNPPNVLEVSTPPAGKHTYPAYGEDRSVSRR